LDARLAAVNHGVGARGDRLSNSFCGFNGLSHPLATVVADASDASLWLQMRVDVQVVPIPLALVDEAIKLAPGGVYSEAWFEKNVEGYSDPGLHVAARS